MKRLWLCVAILAFILSAAFGWAIYLHKSCEKLGSLIDTAQELAEKRSPNTEDAITELCDYWEGFVAAAAFFETSDSLAGMSEAAAKLSYLYAKDNDEFFSECEVVRCGADRIYRSNVPFLPNK